MPAVLRHPSFLRDAACALRIAGNRSAGAFFPLPSAWPEWPCRARPSATGTEPLLAKGESFLARRLIPCPHPAACTRMAEPGEALAYIRAAEQGQARGYIWAAARSEARGYTWAAGQRAEPAYIRPARQEERAASRPSARPVQEPCRPPSSARPRMRQARVREGCEPERPNDVVRAGAAEGQGRVRDVQADRGARRLDRLRDSLPHSPRYGATNRPCTHPYKRGTQLHAPRGFAFCPKIWAKPGNFDDNPGEKVMIV